MLHTTTYGEAGPRIAFCHGLFGQGKNWTTIGKALAAEGYRVTLVDLPNHGRSPWTDEFSYVGMAETVVASLRGIDPGPWTLVGHSMGGKTVMLAALRHPDFVARLVVVDMSPVDYEGLTSFTGYLAGMTSLPVERITTRAQADAHLRDAVPDPAIRAFLLQNLRHEDDGFRWQVNLDLLARSLPDLGGWPADAVVGRTYDGPTLWIAGAESAYVTTEYDAAMRALFPRTHLVTIKRAGHWVHSQQPEVFTGALLRFLAQT